MFVIEASHSEAIDIDADLETVREFFTDIGNYIELMPNIGSISTDEDGTLHWEIIAKVPFVGSFTEHFPVVEIENNEDSIAWGPYDDEDANFLGFEATFEESGEYTRVHFSQTIELRRRSATELHMLAGFAGAKLISTEMEKHVAEMMGKFLDDSRDVIEGE